MLSSVTNRLLSSPPTLRVMSMTSISSPSLSTKSSATATALESIISEDPGKRGIGPLVQHGALERITASFGAVGRESLKVGVLTGFYIPQCSAGETDGPAGAVAIALGVIGVGGKSYCVTDALNSPLVVASVMGRGARPIELDWSQVMPSDAGAQLEEAMKECAGDVPGVPIVSLPLSLKLEEGSSLLSGVSHFVSIERVGPAGDGKCYNMRGEDISEWHGSVHLMHQAALDDPSVFTIGIGDGGNEIGMGSLPKTTVAQAIPKGELICCSLGCDALVVAGVSNWGGYAVAHALSTLVEENADEVVKNRARKWLPDVETERATLDAMMKAGGVDGPTRSAVAKVDGMWFEEEHVELLTRLVNVTKQ